MSKVSDWFRGFIHKEESASIKDLLIVYSKFRNIHDRIDAEIMELDKEIYIKLFQPLVKADIKAILDERISKA